MNRWADLERSGWQAAKKYSDPDFTGNLPGRVGKYENTFCPTCKDPLIARVGFIVTANRLTPDGTCPSCHTHIPGIWS